LKNPTKTQEPPLRTFQIIIVFFCKTFLWRKRAVDRPTYPRLLIGEVVCSSRVPVPQCCQLYMDTTTHFKSSRFFFVCLCHLVLSTPFNGANDSQIMRCCVLQRALGGETLYVPPPQRRGPCQKILGSSARNVKFGKY
jgi:hypothetical protein